MNTSWFWSAASPPPSPSPWSWLTNLREAFPLFSLWLISVPLFKASISLPASQWRDLLVSYSASCEFGQCCSCVDWHLKGGARGHCGKSMINEPSPKSSLTGCCRYSWSVENYRSDRFPAYQRIHRLITSKGHTSEAWQRRSYPSKLQTFNGLFEGKIMENHGKSIGNHGSYHLFPLHCIRLSLYSFFRIFPWINGKPGQFTGRSAGPLRSCGKKGSATGSDNTLQPRFLLCHDIRISSHLIIWMEFRFPQIAQIAAI